MNGRLHELLVAVMMTSGVLLASTQAVSKTDDCPAFQGSNPYGLTTEAQLEGGRASQIDSFWADRALQFFDGVGGLKIAYKSFPVEEGREERAAIAISSGRTEGLVKYPEFVYDLHKQGFAVYIHDHRGQGFSERIVKDKPQMGHVERFDDYVSDLKTFVESVVKKTAHPKTFLVAHSMGGAIASLYLENEKYREDFDAAVLSSPMHEHFILGPLASSACPVVKIGREFRDALSKLGFEEARNYALTMRSYDETPLSFETNVYTHSRVRYKRMRDAYDANVTAKIGGPSATWVAEACWGGWTARNSADKIQTPVLVLQAGGDAIVKAKAQNEFCTKLADKCAEGKPHVIEKAHHELFIECDQYRVPAIGKLLEFLHSQL